MMLDLFAQTLNLPSETYWEHYVAISYPEIRCFGHFLSHQFTQHQQLKILTSDGAIYRSADAAIYCYRLCPTNPGALLHCADMLMGDLALNLRVFV